MHAVVERRLSGTLHTGHVALRGHLVSQGHRSLFQKMRGGMSSISQILRFYQFG